MAEAVLNGVRSMTLSADDKLVSTSQTEDLNQRTLNNINRMRARGKGAKRADDGGFDINNLKYVNVEAVTTEDLNIIEAQLGFLPMNLIEVAARGPDGKPLVLKLYPLTTDARGKKLEPFPTMIWMSCPELKSRISCIEAAGWPTRLQERLMGNGTGDTSDSLTDVELQTVQDRMYEAHKRYAKVRFSLLTHDDLKLVEERGWTKVLQDTGIAGIKEMSWRRKVKCLHAHYANYLWDPTNIIGEWVHELLLAKEDTKDESAISTSDDETDG